MSSDHSARQIIALGGHNLSDCAQDVALSRYILAQSPQSRPRICLLAQASREDCSYILRFCRHFIALGACPSDLSLFQAHTADIAEFLLSQHIIYVGGGNTRSMLALWREWGVDQVLRQAWQQGIVLSGVSAGAICWFAQGLTDSIPGRLTALDCLGFLPGSCSPHYDSETERRPTYQRLVKEGGIMPGYGVDDGAGLHFRGQELAHVIGAAENATAYTVERTSAGLSENRLPATPVLALADAGDNERNQAEGNMELL